MQRHELNFSVNNAGTIFVLKSNVLWQMISCCSSVFVETFRQDSYFRNHDKVIYRVWRYPFSVSVSAML